MLQRAASTLPSLAMCPAAARTLSSSREATTTLAPRLSSSSDIAFPIPVPPPGVSRSGELTIGCVCHSHSPVTIATLSLKSPGRNTDIAAQYLVLREYSDSDLTLLLVFGLLSYRV